MRWLASCLEENSEAKIKSNSIHDFTFLQEDISIVFSSDMGERRGK